MAEVRGGNFTATFVASGNLDATGNQYTFVRQIAGVNMDIVTISTTGDIPVGVLQDKPKDNESGELVTFGHTKIRLASSLGARAAVMAGNSGWAVLASGSGSVVAGRLETGGTSGAVGEMFFNPSFVGSVA